MQRFSIFLSLLILLFSCNNEDRYVKNRSHIDVSDISIAKGKTLASEYCKSCHLLPDPSLLNSLTWQNGVLPAMGPRLGIFEYKYKKYINSLSDPNIRGYYPVKPLLSQDQWQNILDYYSSLSPDSLPKQKKQQSIDTNLTSFLPITPTIKYNTPATCFISANTAHQNIVLSDVLKQAVYVYNKQSVLEDSLLTTGCIVQLLTDRVKKLTACNIGVFTPTNAAAGSIQNITFENNKLLAPNKAIYKQLHRPVYISEADLNADKKTDIVVCEFGYLIGSLSWLENQGDTTYAKHILRNEPGAIKAIVQDFNGDGRPDVMALFAQGDEGIFLFINKGNGSFSSEEVIGFPPSYGSSYFELDDFNKDGYPDILYSCGDNADYSPIFKPYHGVYIYLNDGHNHFKQSFFYAINGCYKAIAKDFDNDGDLDIATIAYFADFANKPDEGFVYLENKGNLTFKPFSLPITKKGRWINMDVGDVDGDNKPDILLANCSIGPTINYSNYDWKKGPPFMILKNNFNFKTNTLPAK